MRVRDGPHVPLGEVEGVALDALPDGDVVAAAPDLAAGVRGGTAEQLAGLEHGHRPAAQRQPQRGGQAGQTGPDDDHVVLLAHPSSFDAMTAVHYSTTNGSGASPRRTCRTGGTSTQPEIADSSPAAATTSTPTT